MGCAEWHVIKPDFAENLYILKGYTHESEHTLLPQRGAM